MNIYQRMAAITAELQTVAKNLTVETTRGKGYKAVSERDIIDAVKPVENKYGVYSYPFSREIIESQMLESESTWNDKTTKKTSFFSRMKTVYRFVNMDEPTDYIETITFAEGIDSQDKGSGKAMTYADKYALMKAYKISTGDDPDQNASEDTKYNNVKSFACPECGRAFGDYEDAKGHLWSAEQMFQAAQEKNADGVGRCRVCRVKHEEALAAKEGKAE
ncbi:MAG: ERF family protein [Oscillospiraceae bacterium]